MSQQPGSRQSAPKDKGLIEEQLLLEQEWSQNYESLYNYAIIMLPDVVFTAGVCVVCGFPRLQVACDVDSQTSHKVGARLHTVEP